MYKVQFYLVDMLSWWLFKLNSPQVFCFEITVQKFSWAIILSVHVIYACLMFNWFRYCIINLINYLARTWLNLRQLGSKTLTIASNLSMWRSFITDFNSNCYGPNFVLVASREPRLPNLINGLFWGRLDLHVRLANNF